MKRINSKDKLIKSKGKSEYNASNSDGRKKSALNIKVLITIVALLGILVIIFGMLMWKSRES